MPARGCQGRRAPLPGLSWTCGLRYAFGLIVARKNALLDSLLYHGYLRWSLRTSFHAIHALGMEHLERLPEDRPVIAFANHTNWWDGLVVFFLTRFQRRRRFFCMMEEKQLVHYRFFSWLGAYSVDLGNSVRAGASLRYTLKLLKEPDSMVWIFPQGRQAAAAEEIDIRPGADFLCQRAAQAQVLPVAFRFAFFREQRPEILIAIGPPLPATAVTEDALRTALQEQVDRLDAAIRADDLSAFRALLRPGWSVNKLWEAFQRGLTFNWRGFRRAN